MIGFLVDDVALNQFHVVNYVYSIGLMVSVLDGNGLDSMDWLVVVVQLLICVARKEKKLSTISWII